MLPMFHVAVQAIFNGSCTVYYWTSNGPYKPVVKTHERPHVHSSYSTLENLPENFQYLESISTGLDTPLYLTPELVPVVAQNAKLS